MLETLRSLCFVGTLAVAATVAATGASQDVITPQQKKPSDPPVGAGEEPPEVPEPAPLADDVKAAVATAESAGPKTAKSDLEDATRTLVLSGDPRVMPALEKILALTSEEHRGVRKMAVMGVVRGFSKQAADVFIRLLESGTTVQKESATYGIGFVDDPRVLGLVRTQLADPNKRIRGAAAYAVVMRAKGASNVCQTRALGGAVDDVPEDILKKNLDAMRDMLFDITMGEGSPEEARDLLYRYADHRTTQRLVEAYRSGLPEEQRALGDLVVRVHDACRRWAGRAEGAPGKIVDFTLSMQNLMSEGKPPKEFALRFDDYDLQTLRGAGSHLDRGTSLEFALDSLLTAPQLCRPQLLEGGDQPKIRFEIPQRASIRAGMGLLGIRYWEAKLVQPAHAVVTIDPERGVPIAEEIFDAEGQRLGGFTFGDYAKLGDGSLAPQQIGVHFDRCLIGAKTVDMQYELDFQLLDGVWLFANGTAMENTAEGAELRAISHTQGVAVRAAEGAE